MRSHGQESRGGAIGRLPNICARAPLGASARRSSGFTIAPRASLHTPRGGLTSLTSLTSLAPTQQRRTARPNRKSIEIPVVANIAKVVGSPTRRVASHTREQARAIAGAESCRDGDGAASCAERAGLRLQGAASPTDRPPPDAPAARGAGAGDECRAEGGEAAGAGDGARDAARDVGRCVLPEVFPTMSEVVFQRTSFLCAFVYSLLFVWLQQGGSSCGSSCCST